MSDKASAAEGESVIEETALSLGEFIDSVRRMRDHQKLYRSTQQKIHLSGAKAWERRVDYFFRQAPAADIEPDLFAND
jgi:hypothetical protein